MNSNTHVSVLGVRSSRKKYGGAIQRHFAGWKDLLYAVDTSTGILIVRPASSAGSGAPIIVGLADTSVLRIPLRRITVSPHFYAPEGAHILSITCEAVGENGDSFRGYCWFGRGSDSSSVGSSSKSSEANNTFSSSSPSSQRHDVNTSDEGSYELYEKPTQHIHTTITAGQGEIVKDELEIQLRLESESDLVSWQLALSEHIRQQQIAIDTATEVGLKAIASYLKKRLHLQSIYSLSEPTNADIQHALSLNPFDVRPSNIPASTSPVKWAHRTSRSSSVGSTAADDDDEEEEGSIDEVGRALTDGVVRRGMKGLGVGSESGIGDRRANTKADSVNSLSHQYREKTVDGVKNIKNCNNDNNDKNKDEHEDEDDDEYLVLREEDDYSIIDHSSLPPDSVAGNNHHNHNNSSRPMTAVRSFLPPSMRPTPALTPVSAPAPTSSMQAAPLTVLAFSHRHPTAMPPLLSVDSKKSGGAFPDPLATASHVKGTSFSTPAVVPLGIGIMGHNHHHRQHRTSSDAVPSSSSSSSSCSSPILNASYSVQPGSAGAGVGNAAAAASVAAASVPFSAGGESAHSRVMVPPPPPPSSF